jgi:hypothetical protein
VMRLSRKVLTGLVGVGAVVVFGALIFALYQGNRRPGSGSSIATSSSQPIRVDRPCSLTRTPYQR